MKRLFKFGVIALAVVAMFACENPQPEPQPEPKPEPEEPAEPSEPAPTTRALDVVACFSATSKATLNDALEIDWAVATNPSLVLLTDKGAKVTSKGVTVEEGDALFSFDIPCETSSVKAYLAPAELTATSMSVSIEALATQNVAGSTEGLALNFATPESVAVAEEATEVVATLALTSSVARYMVYSSNEELVGESVLSVTLNAESDVCGTLVYNLAEGTTSLTAGAKSAKTVLATPYVVGAEKDSAMGVYMEFAPTTAEGAVVVVKTDVATYNFEFGDEALEFSLGAVHTHYFDLKNATSRLENSAHIVSYNTANLLPALSMNALGGEQDMGYFLASVDGVEDTTNYTAEYYTQISFEIVGTSGEAVDWLSGSIVNNNHPVLSVAKNESFEGRTATVRLIYTPSNPKEYSVENPVIATIEVAQNGATATHSLAYQWFGDSVINVVGEGFSGVKGLGYFLAYIDGSTTAVSDAEALEPFFKSVSVSSDADWCVAAIVGGNFNNIQLEAIEANPSTTEQRVATITATFNGDRNTYLMTPDYTAFTIQVVQQPSRAEGVKSQLYYTTNYLTTSLVISSSGITSEKDLGYFFAMVDGIQTDDGGSKWFASLEMVCDAEWVSAQIRGNHIYLTAEPSSVADWRKAKIMISYPESDSDVAVIGGNPVVTIEITQLPAASEAPAAVYTFGNDTNNISLQRDMTVDAGGCTNKGVTWMSVYKIINGEVDGTRDNSFSDEAHAMTYSYVDGEGRSIDWLSASVGGDWLNYSAAENTSGESRVGYIYVHPATKAGQVYEGYNILDPCLVVKVTQSGN